MSGYLFISNGTKPDLSVTQDIDIDIDNFSQAAIYAANELGCKLYMGYNVDHPERLKCRQYNITFFHANIYRNIFAISDNYKAYKILFNFLRSNPDIKFIHCNTPIGGVIGRLCGFRLHKKVIYTAHGFHFYKGAPIINWILFYPIEKFLALITDVLITINYEDFEIAKHLKLHNNGQVYYVPGVGVDIQKIQRTNIASPNIRQELNLDNDAIILLSVGRLDVNKNNETIIKGFKDVKNKNLHLVICGDGNQMSKIKRLVNELNLQNRVHLLGNRNDIYSIYKISDIFVLGSFREGLSRSIMEGMASGLPCVVSDIRGNRDLIENKKGGILVNPHHANEFTKAFDILANDKELRLLYGAFNKERVKLFSLEASQKAFLDIFKKELK